MLLTPVTGRKFSRQIIFSEKYLSENNVNSYQGFKYFFSEKYVSENDINSYQGCILNLNLVLLILF